jgi:molybdopterin/thiamine biosynthesis adenylyltransferase
MWKEASTTSPTRRDRQNTARRALRGVRDAWNACRTRVSRWGAFRARLRGRKVPVREYRCPVLRGVLRVSDRQERLERWDQGQLARATVVVAGGGGVGGEVAEGLARKGVGRVIVADPDTVAATDLNRQKFTRHDLYRPKAEALARLLSRQACLGSVLVPHVGLVQDLDLAALQPDALVCCVDQKKPGTRGWLARTCRELQIPVVFAAVSTDADWGYTFIQESTSGTACWNCAFKTEYDQHTIPEPTAHCPGTPAAIDILKLTAAWALYGVDSLIMKRPRDWNYRSASLSQREFGSTILVAQRAGCVACNTHTDSRDSE